MKSAPFYAALLAAQQHLAVDPSEAERRAKAILKAAPKMPAATLLLAQARRRLGPTSDWPGGFLRISSLLPAIEPALMKPMAAILVRRSTNPP